MAKWHHYIQFFFLGFFLNPLLWAEIYITFLKCKR